MFPQTQIFGGARRWVSSLAILGAFLLDGTARAGDLAEAREWYKTLGFPEVAELPYVRVVTGFGDWRSGWPAEYRHVEGFLLNETPEVFTVLVHRTGRFNRKEDDDQYQTWSIQRFTRWREGPSWEGAWLEKLDFPKAAASELAQVRELAGQHSMDYRGAGAFAFGQACRQKGLPEIATAMEEIVAQNYAKHSRGDGGGILEDLQRDIGAAVFWNAQQRFADPSVSWRDLLTPFEHFAERYPQYQEAAYTKKVAEILRQTIDEEAQHHPKPYPEMTPAEQIAENIYQLRSLRFWGWASGRYPIATWTASGQPDPANPVVRLVDMGDIIVPALIDTMDDQHFTRSAAGGLDYGPPHPFSVGEVAQQILENMAHRSFWPSQNRDTKLTKRQLAEAWWAKRQRKGEKQSLVEDAAAGGDYALAAAETLVDRYPEAALAAIEAGIRATRSGDLRGKMVEVASRLRKRETTDFLKAQLAGENGLEAQIAAAWALQAVDAPKALSAMITAWNKIQPRLPGHDRDAWRQAGRLIKFLTESGTARALDALRADFGMAPADVQLAIIRALLPELGNQMFNAKGETVEFDTKAHGWIGNDAALAIDRLLVAALGQKATRHHMRGSIDGTIYEDPRVCDLAAFVLARRWPQKYQFAWSGTVEERDAQVALMREQWRAEAAAVHAHATRDSK